MLFQLGVSSAVQFQNTDVLVIKPSLQQTAVCNPSVMCFETFCVVLSRQRPTQQIL